MKDPTHIHEPSHTYCRIKKVYGSVATVYVDEFPISILWGKKEYSDTMIVNVRDLKPIK